MILKWIKKMMMMWEQDFVDRDPSSMSSATAKFDMNNYIETKKIQLGY